MKSKSTTLTKEERDTLVLGGIHPDGKQLSNAEIGQPLGLSVNRVKTIIHQSCVKLQAHNRNKAVLLALIRREISILDMFSPNELIEVLAPLGAESIEKMAHLVGEKLEQERLRTAG